MNGTKPRFESERPKTAIEIRREAVAALATQKQLERRQKAAADLAEKLEELAIEALTEGRDRVRPILDQRIEALKQAERLAEQLRAAIARANRLKADLLESGSAAS